MTHARRRLGHRCVRLRRRQGESVARRGRRWDPPVRVNDNVEAGLGTDQYQPGVAVDAAAEWPRASTIADAIRPTSRSTASAPCRKTVGRRGART